MCLTVMNLLFCTEMDNNNMDVVEESVEYPNDNSMNDPVETVKNAAAGNIDGLEEPEGPIFCKVCGDSSPGMYFGAQVCVPCKVSICHIWLQTLLYLCVL